MRGRWIALEQCIQPSASWAAARFNWKSSSLQRNWPSEEGWYVMMMMMMRWDLNQFYWHVVEGVGFIDRVMVYTPKPYI